MLWNKDTELLEALDIQEGDSIKVLGAQSRLRNGVISLSHFYLGRIIKGDFDVPEYTESVLKIGDAHEMRDVTVFGVVSKIYDTITFVRDDASTGQVRSLEIEDNTGKIRVTLWNEDTKISLKKGRRHKNHRGKHRIRRLFRYRLPNKHQLEHRYNSESSIRR